MSAQILTLPLGWIRPVEPLVCVAHTAEATRGETPRPNYVGIGHTFNAPVERVTDAYIVCTSPVTRTCPPLRSTGTSGIAGLRSPGPSNFGDTRVVVGVQPPGRTALLRRVREECRRRNPRGALDQIPSSCA